MSGREPEGRHDLLAVLPSSVQVCRARAEDVPVLVGLLADDPVGSERELVEIEPYRRAFTRIAADPNQLLVAGWSAGELVATLQLSVLPGLSRGGALRGQIEGVRVRADSRGRGVGGELIGWVITHARRQGCALVQLTTDKSRVDAHRFYSGLGFTASHEGFKLEL